MNERDKMTVMLTTEGTYPFHQGGVSTWCDFLVQRLDEVDYIVYSVLMDPFVAQKFELPERVKLIKMPLWGTEEPSEHLTTPFSQHFLAKKRTTRPVIDRQFIPLFEELIREIIRPVKNPKRLGRVMLDMHLYFQHYEYKVSFKSEQAWERYKRIVLEHVEDRDHHMAQPDIYGLIQSLGWVYRFMNLLNTPVPDVHVTHSSAAAFCGIPCVLAKLKNKTPFLLTEHGVYLREQYLSLAKRNDSSFLNTFLIRLVHSVTSLNYWFADQISPVCRYNTRWEREFGVEPEKIEVIHNGVNKDAFLPTSSKRHTTPTVVMVARIDPVKDIEMLIKAADAVKKRLDDVKFIIYGSVSVPEYYEQCLKLRDRLGLEDTVIFAGHTANVAEAYKSADIVALTSISEAFPYSVIEAMMSGKAVISTDVGGVKEALGDTGMLVPPGDFERMAREIVQLLQFPDLRASLAEDAKERALSHFTIEKVLRHHLQSYIRLALGVQEKPRVIARPEKDGVKRQREWMEKGIAARAAGEEQTAVAHLQKAIRQAPDSPAVPVILLELADIYNRLGQYDRAFVELEKHKALQTISA